MTHNKWLLVGGIMGFLGVALGAFGAHGIEEWIPNLYGVEDLPTRESVSDQQEIPDWYRLDQLHQEKLTTWKTGVRYHFYHGLAVVLVGILLSGQLRAPKLLEIAALLFVLGVIGFSGSIYLYVITKIKIFGMTAALGGTVLLVGWFCFVLGVVQLPKLNNQRSNDQA